jgi:KipI family sensor histidine kinase inhibitor
MSGSENMRIIQASDRSLLVSFGEKISLDAHRVVLRLTRSLEGAPELLNLHPAYASVLIDFDPRRRRHAAIEDLIRERLEKAPEPAPGDPRLVEIPVQYGGGFGPDLNDVAQHTGLTAERVVEIHSSVEYLVYFLGFSPGFPYLGGMAAEISTPRLASPRKQVPAGSVAIGGSQTGVYPMATPGGWRIIGRTSLKLFDAQSDSPALLRMGDRVRFIPIGETRG